MAESPTPSSSISTISPAKTPATNQKNITNFFRVTTPTPASKRDIPEPKATPKKILLPPKAKKTPEGNPSPVVDREIFVLEDDPPVTEHSPSNSSILPVTEVSAGPDVVLHQTLDSNVEIARDETPRQEVQETVVVVDPVSSPSANPVDPISPPSVDLTTFVECPPNGIPSTNLITDMQPNNDHGCESQPQEEDLASKKRSRKKTLKYSDDQYRSDAVAHPGQSVTSLLSLEVIERLANCQQKATSIVQSLALDHRTLITSLETCYRAELAQIKKDIEQLLELPSESSEVAISQSIEVLSEKLRKFTQYFVQDRTCTLPELLRALKNDFDLLRDLTSLSSHDLVPQLQTLLKPYDTAEYVKEFSRRVSYGYRSSAETKETSLFDDQSELALWRWEVIVLPDDFSNAEDIKAAKIDFTRVGKAVRAILKVSSEISKSARATGTVSSQDEVKINALEDKVTAAMGEIQKANERKATQLKKKLAQEAEAEKRNQRKEEIAAARAAKASEDDITKKRSSLETVDSSEKIDELEVSRKKPKPLGEKELKELATIEKQKSMLMNFLKKPLNSSLPQAHLGEAESADPLPLSPIPVDAAPIAAPQPSCTADLNHFLQNPLSMSEIILANKRRFDKAKEISYHRRHRKFITLSVTITAPQADCAFDSGLNNYAEIKDVLVDSRKRLLSFAEDYRPAYFGTFSKRSRLVSGRRPFAKDPLLNYDYDSEAEWEEEDPEGEDIALSDNEEDGEGDEIVYDDFFRPDNEIDDPDGDGDAMAPPAPGHHHRVTVNGVRFIGTDVRPRAIAVGSGEAVEVASADADSEILLNYSSVIHPSFGESDRPSRFSVGIPSRLATLGVALNKGEPDLGKDLKDSRNFKESMLPTLALFVHGKKEGADKLVDAFVESLHATESPVPPKAQIKKRILELAERKKGSGSGESGETPERDSTIASGPARWRVHQEAAAKLGLELPPIEASLPSRKPKKRATLLKDPVVPGEEVSPSDKSAGSEDPITKVIASAASESAKVSLLQFFPSQSQTTETSAREAVDTGAVSTL